MAKRYTRINWQNEPNTATPISAENLNKMDKGIKDCDDAIGDLALLTTNNKTDLVSAINEQNNNLAVQTGTITASSGFTIAPTNSFLTKSGKVVALQLVISTSVPINTTASIAMLPNGFRPAYPINYMCRGSNSQFNADGIMYLYIGTNGEIQVRPKAGESYTFVAINCSFIVN